MRLLSHFRRTAVLASLVSLLAGVGCGKDAERTYAGLSKARVELEAGGYVVRYLDPPWKRVKDDPLATGARKSVPIGGMSYPIFAESGVVLEIDRESNIDEVDALVFPKYRLDAALVSCDPEKAGDLSCAEYLAGLDYEARQSDGKFDRFGPEPRQRKNDAGQKYYELLGQVDATGRFRRVIFFEGDDAPESIAGWVMIEANPDLGERETSELVEAVEMLPSPGAEP